MADVTIPGLTALTSIDRAADLFEVSDTSDSGNSKKTTVNNMLNITSQPMGLTDSQSPTNKTFDNTNIYTIRDDRLTLQDNSDTTKQAVFQLSGITTGTTRTYTLPNVSDTLVSLTATQTLTNKTLTSPTISAPTITNPTITVDTISEFTAANGVTIDGLNLKDGKLNTNNSVVTANITDDAVTGAKIGSYYIERQNNTTNSTENTAKFASGWGVITATAASSFNEAVTFPFTFTSRPIVLVSFGGDDIAGGTTYGDGGNERHGAVTAKAANITTTGFTAYISQAAGSNWTAGDTLFYQWVAVGS